MDFEDDDRFNNYDYVDTRKLQTFKVPKKNLTNKSMFEKVPLQSNEYKDNIFPKIITSYKNPNSCISLKIVSAYSICNTDVEKEFTKRKQSLKKDFSPQTAIESFGFVYLSNLSEFRNVVKNGKLRIGNLKESVIGKASMGVCVSLFSDIYHPGEGKNFPRNGLLLIVKYLKGRVYYVVEDNDPMEPQPNYDCHISKNCNQESFPSLARAFHSTQVYMYEYSDDFDLIEAPSQILPWAAVEFTWIGSPLYKLLSIPISVAPTDSNHKDLTNKFNDKRIKPINRNTGCPLLRMKQLYTDSIPIFCTQLQLKLPKLQKDEELSEILPLDIPVTILSYHTLWTSFDPLMTASWQICELIEWSAFEKGFIQPLIKDRNNDLNDENFSISDVFNKRLTISRNIENKFSKNMLDAMKLSTFGTQYVNYLRMVVNDPSRDRAKMARLVEYFSETKTVGRVRIYDNSDSLLFVFPDNTLSQNFGIPSVRTLDVNYLHLLLVTNKSLDFNFASRTIDESVEIELKDKLLHRSTLLENRVNDCFVPLHVLQQSINCQNKIQKSKLRQICGINTNTLLKFEEINFEPSTNPLIDTSRFEDIVLNSSQKPNFKSQNSIQKIESPLHDRPYDPSENPVGLSDIDTIKANNLKRANEVKKSDDPLEPVSKKSKREDIKSELNSKLFQLFAKIENCDSDNQNTNSPDSYTTPSYQKSFYNSAGNSNICQYNRGANSATLDRSKYHTQFRNGVSVYEPELSNSFEPTNNTMDKDFRFQDSSHQFIYSDRSLRPNGFNR